MDSLPKGWINRQIARLEREAKTWPDWMRRSDMQKEKSVLSSRHLKAIMEAESIAPPRPWIRELCEEVLRLREEVAELMRERIAREEGK